MFIKRVIDFDKFTKKGAENNQIDPRIQRE